ncbi:hypothetical protein A5709_15225 [Mycobacterium sp. E1386]|uniref:hypothetical protein n=1 Tax=Mycobacterium sp. E1386 TaxID=1834126 RepID=UPI0007FD4D26|nr:hypothetical protein [Mycobacterium sp. E1386]OBI37181.1 hypothetical protein A5709_15225 [Mycobacterium sp. E1386]
MSVAKKAGQATPSKYQPRATTPDELIAGAAQLRARLTRHLDALERRDPGAVQDVAAVLRTALAHGKGDDVVRRLCRAARVPLPQVRVSQPANQSPHVLLAAGAMPVLVDDDADQVHPQLVDIDRWTRMPALVVAGGLPHRVTDWNELIGLYANTYGSHLSGTIPEVLSNASRVRSDGLDLGEYLVHCAGIIGEDALDQALDATAGHTLVVPGKRHRILNPLCQLTLGEDSDGPYFSQAVNGKYLPVGKPTDVLKLRFANYYVKVTLTLGNDGKVRGGALFSENEPDWWNA